MKALAEFVERGQLQAAAVAGLAVASLFFAWIGAAVVALLILRRGINIALPVMLAALIPASLWVFVGDIGPVMTLLGSAILAQILRLQSNWVAVLLAMPFVLGGMAILVIVAAPDYVASLQNLTEQLLTQFKQRLAASDSQSDNLQLVESIAAPTGSQLIGMFALLQSVTVFFSLVLARWWQALLYNPGGFQREFHALRFTRVPVLIVVACFVVVFNTENYQAWAWLFIVPLAIAGVAMVHGLIAIAGVAARWLVLFYIALILFRPTLPLLVAVAVADSALDFRARLRTKIEKRR